MLYIRSNNREGKGRRGFVKLNRLKRANRISFIILILFLLTLLLSACTNKEQTKHKIPAKNERSKVSITSIGREWKLPISIPEGEGEFYKLVGWFSDTEVLYITNLEQTSSIFRYNLLSGKSKLILRVGIQLSLCKSVPQKNTFWFIPHLHHMKDWSPSLIQKEPNK